MSMYGDRAYAAFFKGYNCCQSVAVAFADEMGMTEKQALQLSAGFGGGFGRMREVCGAFSGMVLVLSSLYGCADPTRKTEIYSEIQALATRYKQENGGNSIICRELLGLDKPEGDPHASPRTDAYYKKRPCAELCRIAADELAEYIAAHPLEG